MARIKKTVLEKAEEAANQARQQVRKSQKKRRVRSSEPKTPTNQNGWIEDIWGDQGQIYRCEGKYLITVLIPIGPDTSEARTVLMTPEEYVRRFGGSEKCGNGNMDKPPKEKNIARNTGKSTKKREKNIEKSTTKTTKSKSNRREKKSISN